MLAPITHIQPLTTINRERILPLPGRVVVRKGQKVTAADIIAETNLAPKHLLLNVATGLRIPVEKVKQYIQRQVGENVSQDDIIAGPVGFPRRVVRTPVNGKVVLVENGEVLIEVENPAYELHAGLPGEVISLIPDRGAIIRTTGALIQAVWGNGRIDLGLLRSLMKRPDDVLTSTHLDMSLRGAVVLGGHCGEEEALEYAADIPLRGLIMASMSSYLVPLASAIQFPIVLIEGFGKLPMNKAAFDLLSTSARREVSLNAQRWDRFMSRRPEIVVPLPAPEETPEPKEATFFAPQQRVRILRSPYQSEVCTLVAVRNGYEMFSSGIKAQTAELRRENGDMIMVPLSNLEVLL